MTVRLNAFHALPAGDLVVARGAALRAAMGGLRPARRPAGISRLEACLTQGKQYQDNTMTQVEGVARHG